MIADIAVILHTPVTAMMDWTPEEIERWHGLALERLEAMAKARMR